jgi:hypothetical protein
MIKEDIIERNWISTVGDKIYNEVKKGIDENGWLKGWTEKIPMQVLFMFDGRFNDSELRPRSLRGIDDNMGWSKPKENGLPKTSGDYIFLAPNKVQHTFSLKLPLSKEDIKHYLEDFTHYKPQKNEPLPFH